VINLIIDIGNTRTKVALFNNGELILSFPTFDFTETDINVLKEEHREIEAAIVSTTKKYPGELIDLLKKNFEFVLFLDHETPLPIENCYETPETLGKDRLAAAIGANKLFPKQNVLVIDAGTAVTYDLVNDQDQYLGGFITPGLTMRFKALNQFTSQLPLLEPGTPKTFFNKNTTDAIIGGVQLGLEGELIRMIDHFSVNKSELKLILTGGDVNYFGKLLKNHNFVCPEITQLGLNTILEFNYTRSYNRQSKC